LNGIAYLPATGHLALTGKLWPWIFEAEVVPDASPAVK
jgi:glutamine cyclotransferase